jgi:hypothetical protein
MTNTGASAFNISGNVEVATPTRDTEMALTVTVDQIEAKSNEYNIPPANSGSPFAVPMNFSPGVTEALVVFLECSSPLKLTLTSSDATHGGPFTVGINGPLLLVMQPGEGLTGISVVNPSLLVSVNLGVSIGSLATSTDQPPYFYPPTP